MKLTDMPYKRVTPEETAPLMDSLTRRVRESTDAACVLDAFWDCQALNERVATMMALAHIRFTMDTGEAVMSAENDYYDEVSPRFEESSHAFRLALVASPHRKALEERLGSLLFKNIEIENRTFAPEIQPDMQEENRLTTAYVKLLSSALIPFDGKTLTLSQLVPYEQSPDRAVRRAACEAKSGFFEKNAPELDSLYDKLVHVRHNMATTLGFENFIELGYCRMGRNCYTQRDVAGFRGLVKTHVVPLAEHLKANQASRIGQKRLSVYDDPLLFPDGNAKPHGTPEEIFAHGRAMYRELSPQTAEFFDFMMDSDLFDVLQRPGKAPGGYCTYLPLYRSPFVFANFNGTSHDIDVLTHEAGHALAAYLSRDNEIGALRNPTIDACEIHSMSMEFFTWPWMEGFFGGQTEKYRYGHLSGAVCFLPYGAMVDEFQHIVYQNPGMTPGQRRLAWLELEREYRPWLAPFDGAPEFYRSGGRWQAQTHIYEVPFYYIDYCLAQTMALCFWKDARSDPASAWERYIKLVSLAGTLSFSQLIEKAGLPSPFDPRTLTDIAGAAEEWLLNKV